MSREIEAARTVFDPVLYGDLAMRLNPNAYRRSLNYLCLRAQWRPFNSMPLATVVIENIRTTGIDCKEWGTFGGDCEKMCPIG